MDETLRAERVDVQSDGAGRDRFVTSAMRQSTLVGVGLSTALVDGVSGSLHFSAYNVVLAENAAELVEFLREQQPQYIVIELSKDNSLTFHTIRDIRRIFRGPLVVLGDDVDLADRVMSLEMGADNYLSRFISARALHAHLKASERAHSGSSRTAVGYTETVGVSNFVSRDPSPHLEKQLISDGWTLNMLHSVVVAPDGRSVRLTTFERLLLAVLMDAAPRVVPRDWMMAHMGGYRGNPGNRTLDVIICRVRTKLRYIGANWPIHNFRGLGYKFVGFPGVR